MDDTRLETIEKLVKKIFSLYNKVEIQYNSSNFENRKFGRKKKKNFVFVDI